MIIHFATSNVEIRDVGAGMRGTRYRPTRRNERRRAGKSREVRMAREEAAAEAAHAMVRQLVAEKFRILMPMTVIFMVSYIGLTVLAGFARDLTGTRVVGSVNLGFTLIAFNYLLSWTLAIVYGRVAARRFDPLAAKAAAAASERGN
jgi:uncharacterized membrane protein (DUF485 family)